MKKAVVPHQVAARAGGPHHGNRMFLAWDWDLAGAPAAASPIGQFLFSGQPVPPPQSGASQAVENCTEAAASVVRVWPENDECYD